LRWYGAEEELLDGRGYDYPVVTRQGAVRGGNSSYANETDQHGPGSVTFDGGAAGARFGESAVRTAAVLTGLVLGLAAFV
jgi:hypothetical protein